MNSDGTVSIYSQRQGFLMDILVDEGQMVEEGDIIAKLGSEDDIFNLKQIDRRIRYVENMTYDSELDTVTSDTQEMAQIKLSARQSGDSKEKTEAELDLKKEKLQRAADELNEAEERMLQYKEKYYDTLNLTDERNTLAYQEANTDYDTHFNLYEQAKTSYINAKESYYALKAEFDSKYGEIDTTDLEEEALAAYEAALADLESARTKADDLEYFMEEEEKKLNVANETLEVVRKDYLEYLNTQSGNQAENTIASTEYSQALTEYNTQKSQYKALSDDVDELELQNILADGDSETSEENYRQQFDNKKSAVLSELNDQRERILNEASKNEVVATSAGKVYDIPLEVGEGVVPGNIVADLLTGDLGSMDAVCYVRLADAKKVELGMPAYVYPSTVNKQEYGHILAQVSSISSHVASTDDLLMQLGTDSLVKEFEAEGPVVEIRCRLRQDPTTKSGYAWSSHRGSEIKLNNGTEFTVTIVTEQKRPVDLLIPYIKDKLDFNIEDDTIKVSSEQ
ncbi:MAG: hypothetical protein K6F28_11980 [Lachnospiraceae bacterium]|nr:hypothetical protein [Lachnospiraceae bacterium]